MFKSMIIGNLVCASLAIGSYGTGTLSAATITDQTFNADNNLGDDWFLEGTTATWSIDPGVTVTASRFFIETNGGANGGANFIVDGGGTLLSSSNSTCCGTRLGHQGGNGIGTISIGEGTTFRQTSGAFGGSGDGGVIDLLGPGATFSAHGTYDSGTQQFNGSIGGLENVAVVFNGELRVSDLGGGVTQLTVIPEPSSIAIGSLGGLMLLVCVWRRRRSQGNVA